MTTSSVDDCQYACYMRTDCLAFSYSGLCFLMSAAVGLTASNAYTTGAKNIGESRGSAIAALCLDKMMICYFF